MTKVVTNNKYYSEIAEAIREQLNTSSTLSPFPLELFLIILRQY